MAASLGFELKEFDATGLSGSYQNLGTALSLPAREVQIFNTSNVEVYISQDGSTNILRIPATDDIKLSAYAKHNALNEARFVFDSGTQLRVLQVTGAGSSGDIIAHIYT